MIIHGSREEKPRKDWERKIEQIAQKGEDGLLDSIILDHSWDKAEWQ
jgi:hypothetical protein